jgi:20S proteasome alpha/beta subunit
MTIAVGFKCVDGIVLAADSLYTEGDAKLYGQKIFPIPSNGRYALTIAGAGGVPSLKGIVREIEKRLESRIGRSAKDFSRLRSIVEGALGSYYPKHIDSAPLAAQNDLGVQLLIAMWVSGSGTRLFESSRTAVFEVEEHRCVGIGSHSRAT